MLLLRTIISTIAVIIATNFELCFCGCARAEYMLINGECCPMCAPGKVQMFTLDSVQKKLEYTTQTLDRFLPNVFSLEKLMLVAESQRQSATCGQAELTDLAENNV